MHAEEFQPYSKTALYFVLRLYRKLRITETHHQTYATSICELTKKPSSSSSREMTHPQPALLPDRYPITPYGYFADDTRNKGGTRLCGNCSVNITILHVSRAVKYGASLVLKLLCLLSRDKVDLL
jgi:hypothetical protein